MPSKRPDGQVALIPIPFDPRRQAQTSQPRMASLTGASFKNVNLREVDLKGVLIDPEAIEGQKIRSSRGISRLEKLALGLFARAKGKDRLRANRHTKPHRSGKHI